MVHTLGINEVSPYKKKILVVDDYVPTRQMIVEALNSSGYDAVSEAENGREALDMFKDDSYDLVISDVMMPRMGGIDLLQNLRDLHSDTAVIMITAQPAVDLTVKAMKTGAVDFLKKPFNIDELLYKVHVYLQENNILNDGAKRKGGLSRELSDKQEELSVHSYIYDSVETIEGDNETIFEKIVDMALRVVEGDVCHLLLYDKDEGDFHPKVIRPADQTHHVDESIRALKHIYLKSIENEEAMIIHSPDNPMIAPSLICAPLMIRGNAFAILSVRKKKDRGLFTNKDLHYVLSLTKRASLNLENKLLYESLYANVLDTFRSLIASIQVRDHYTEEHSSRVTKMAIDIAASMGCSGQEIESLKVAGVLHDIGKIAIPDAVLLKPDRLTNEEYDIIKGHSQLGETILAPIALYEREREIVLYHHERWDGRGYPRGLKGEDIPLLARIISVADTFDAITNTRPYRTAQTVEFAIAEIEKCRNTQLDSRVVDHFMKII
ncbi:MAG: Protein-glutamate methylesterase/protein-glutamine glutaminase [Syntrophus sp. SKADARSKE-3]|nr:Protein-glutamate methylesterase/protein-glutamine glutaminase [Syntrophus sp. SKADARSKE-3]